MYCTKNDILKIVPEKELINLTNDTIKPDSKVNESLLEEIIDESGELIDGYLRSRFPLPLLSTPKLINSIAKDITVYKLYSRRPQKINETVKNNNDSALSLLLQIQKGYISLAVEIPNNQETKLKTNYGQTNKRPEDRIFRNLRAYDIL